MNQRRKRAKEGSNAKEEADAVTGQNFLQSFGLRPSSQLTYESLGSERKETSQA